MIFACLNACLMLALLPSVRAANCLPRPRLVIVLLPGLRADDLSADELPSLKHMIETGGAGWMLCRGARAADRRLLRPDGRETTASLLTTIGSGSRALAPSTLPLSPKAMIAALRSTDEKLDHNVPLGAVGNMFHRLGLSTATIGDEYNAWPDRNAWMVATDPNGLVDFPTVVPPLIPDCTAPYGVRTDVPAVLARFAVLQKSAGLIVIVCEQLARADSYAAVCRPATAMAHRADARRTIEILLAGILSACRSGTDSAMTPILVCSPAPAESSEVTDRLAPIVSYSNSTGGTLASASTRRPGLVLNTDILATIAEMLNSPLPFGATGRPFRTVSDHATSDQHISAVSALNAQYSSLFRISRLQNSPGGLPTIQLLFPLIGTTLLFFGMRTGSEKSRHLLFRFAAAAASVTVMLPLGMLLLPLLNQGTNIAAGVSLFVLSLLAAQTVFLRVRIVPTLFQSLSLAMVLILLIDLLTGTHLLQAAWMSYSVMEGARFYGIGNEYMGVAIGASCMLFGLGGPPKKLPSSADKRTPNLPLLGFSLLIVIVTAEMGVLGAKVGAIPSAGIVFGVIGIVMWRGNLRIREVGGLILLATIGLGLLALIDSHRAAGDQTHFIRALSGAGGGGLADILRRKLQLEGWLLLHSSWSAALLTAGACLLWIRFTHPALFLPRRQKATLAGIGSGALACLLCNDSGLTAAALLLLYGWAWAAALTAVSRSSPPTPVLGQADVRE